MRSDYPSEALIDHDRLIEVLLYEPSTGLFTWVNARTGKGSGRKNQVAGSKHNHGYVAIRIDYKPYLAHRLAWLYMTGEWPVAQVDHINGCRSDNHWRNLRAADPTLNGENQRKAQSTNACGLLGVCANKSRWSATIMAKGIRHHLGTFDTPEEAHGVYVQAKRRLHAGCTI